MDFDNKFTTTYNPVPQPGFIDSTIGIYQRLEGPEWSPVSATTGSAGADLKACLIDPTVKMWDTNNRMVNMPVLFDQKDQTKKHIKLPPFFRVLVPTGLIFDMPEPYYIELFVRSSVAAKAGVTLANSVAVIDTDYREETFVLMVNLSDRPFIIGHGDRIAQMIVKTKITPTFRTLKAAPGQAGNRDGGIGSTGV